MKSSKLIWCAQNMAREYNQTVLFKKELDVNKTDRATVQITADSWHRVSVNGKWIHDGPARADWIADMEAYEQDILAFRN